MSETYPLQRESEFSWRIEPTGKMRVPGIIYADEELIRAMDDKVFEQLCNVAGLPGIVQAAYAMPDAHWGYGFPIGGVAAFDADQGGVVSAGGVGFDISCGVRALRTGLTIDEIEPVKKQLADALFRQIPVGVGSTGRIHLNDKGMTAMLRGGARWAVEQGFGEMEDLQHIEEKGCMAGAVPDEVSARARKRQQDEMGTLGSGNHYLEVQRVAQIYDQRIATAFGLRENDVIVFIHCGSRGLGHQIGTEFLKYMVLAASQHGIELPDRELACAPINSELGQAYLGAMRAGINCALANRQIITHLTRQVFADVLPKADLTLLFDVSHNTCKVETHLVDGRKRKLYVHRKGATRAFGPGNPDLPETLRAIGQPVLIGGSMGTESHILAGSEKGTELSFNSACHGAGRAMSRHQATKLWKGRSVVDELADRGIIIRSPSMRGVAEEAPGAYKDVRAVVDAAEKAGLAHKVARVEPHVCIKG
ncbi:tRNA-splicing ligase RtcB [Microbulbifer donghaiensis]|uniref:tRNA-splicing ligase RtcB n=1 Tax=Microbulbifer donghaiensis TaxID=494016 RepID=A0A1M4WIL6_9GAMM|nr:RtcB family protein [Microbulbifer donghaiensis]SHE81131.1 tRNA-splicing ligase RtcB [Microbulbifer donghaiensis]